MGAKVACKILMKLTTGVNFTNILLMPFCAKVLCTALLFLQFGFEFFDAKILTQKLLVKC